MQQIHYTTAGQNSLCVRMRVPQYPLSQGCWRAVLLTADECACARACASPPQLHERWQKMHRSGAVRPPLRRAPPDPRTGHVCPPAGLYTAHTRGVPKSHMHIHTRVVLPWPGRWLQDDDAERRMEALKANDMETYQALLQKAS
jgi:hypothetical protein